MVNYLPFAPSTILAGALLLALVTWRRRLRPSPTTLAILAFALSMLACVALWWVSRGSPLSAILLVWAPSPAVTITASYFADPWSTFFAGTVTLVGFAFAAASQAQPKPNEDGRDLTSLVLLGAGLLLVNLFFSASLVLIYVSLVAFGFFVYAGFRLCGPGPEDAGTAQAVFVIGQFSAHGLLAAMILLGVPGLTAFPIANSLPGGGIAIASGFLLVFVAASGIYPLAPYLLGAKPDPILRLAPFAIGYIATGLYLSGRLFAPSTGLVVPLYPIILVVFGLVTTLFAATVAWRQADSLHPHTGAVVAEIGLASVALGLATPLAISAAILLFLDAAVTLALSTCCRLIPLGRQQPDPAGDQERYLVLLKLLATASSLGCPPLLGFVGRLALFAAALGSGQIYVLPVVLLASTLLIASSLRYFDPKISRLLVARQPSSRKPGRVAALALGVLSTPIVLLGIAPQAGFYHLVTPTVATFYDVSAIPGSYFGASGLAGPAPYYLVLVAFLPILLALQLYPLPQVRANMHAACLPAETDVGAPRADSRSDAFDTLVHVVCALCQRFLDPERARGAASRVLSDLCNVVNNLSAIVEERFYFPALVILGITLLFVFLG
ncbi:MAG: hypothetical protein HY675_03510 [Chloroflexi bacterium]|nr:hypothetical protein [Chloroflexota bacterium]